MAEALDVNASAAISARISVCKRRGIDPKISMRRGKIESGGVFSLAARKRAGGALAFCKRRDSARAPARLTPANENEPPSRANERQ
jgi:hypothetical protein